jgi:type 1 glutamine amidotransferase
MGKKTKDKPLKLAVVTGSHPFDVPNFHKLFRKLKGIRPLIQHMEDFTSSPEDVRDGYDAVLFYHMIMDKSVAGSEAALEHLGQTPQGVVVLHHSILAYPQWDLWTNLTGLADRSFGFHPDQQLRIEIADADHPITKSLKPWDMGDETYTMAEPTGDSHVLLTTEHEKCMKTIAWTRQHKASRVFCFQSGHDNVTWADKNFCKVLRRGILWAANRL